MQSSTPPFHRLLSFYSTRSPYPDTSTIRLLDSLTGNLALGLDFPVALAIALGRHLYLRNTGFFSLAIHVPSVPVTKTFLDDFVVDGDEKRTYTRSELWSAASGCGLVGQVDALGLWALASDVRTGLLRAEDVRAFQRGTLFEEVVRRRRGREQVLPLWRGGPISVAGHSWVVGALFGVDVYWVEEKGD